MTNRIQHSVHGLDKLRTYLKGKVNQYAWLPSSIKLLD